MGFLSSISLCYMTQSKLLQFAQSSPYNCISYPSTLHHGLNLFDSGNISWNQYNLLSRICITVSQANTLHQGLNVLYFGNSNLTCLHFYRDFALSVDVQSVYQSSGLLTTKMYPSQQMHLTGSNPSTPTNTQPPTSVTSSGSQPILLDRQDSNLSTGQ